MRKLSKKKRKVIKIFIIVLTLIFFVGMLIVCIGRKNKKEAVEDAYEVARYHEEMERAFSSSDNLGIRTEELLEDDKTYLKVFKNEKEVLKKDLSPHKGLSDYHGPEFSYYFFPKTSYNFLVFSGVHFDFIYDIEEGKESNTNYTWKLVDHSPDKKFAFDRDCSVYTFPDLKKIFEVDSFQKKSCFCKYNGEDKTVDFLLFDYPGFKFGSHLDNVLEQAALVKYSLKERRVVDVVNLEDSLIF